MSIVTRARAGLLAVTCACAASSAEAQQPQTQQAQVSTQQPAGDAAVPAEQLDSLVAPIALYPDPLLAQVLAASTYPLEVMELSQWLPQNATLKDQALVQAVEKKDWDPSVQALAGLPDVVKLLTSDIKWTTALGNAFLAQQSDVMDAVQRMRRKAKSKGTLQSSAELKVEDQNVDGGQVVVIEQASPEVVYVPSYNPTVVYGAPVAAYPYPSAWYPGVGLAGAALSFGAGVAMGAMFSGGWGWNAGWHGGNNNINVNRNNTFNRNAVARGGGNFSGGSWQHNAQHRGGTPYGNRATADRFGGTTRGASASQRAAGARQQQARAGGNAAGFAGGGARGGGGDRVGNRSVGGGGGGSAFGGGSRGSYDGGAARQSSARGNASRSGGAATRSSGGASRGGGGASRGGASRGGGGGRGGGGRGGGRR